MEKLLNNIGNVLFTVGFIIFIPFLIIIGIYDALTSDSIVCRRL